METLIANLGAARQVTDSHGTWLVAPMTLIVPGVLDGSKGPLYYPPQEIANNYQRWEGYPLTRNHPMKGKDPVSAFSEGILNRVGLGVVRNPRIVDNKLTAEGWFHEQKTKAVDPKIWNALKSGQQLELSTGLSIHNDVQNGYCPITKRPYKSIARNYQPDHVAVLTDGQRGACSINDGCGVNNEAAESCSCDGKCDRCKKEKPTVEQLLTTFNADDGQWKTLPNGVHILVKDGEIVGGPKVSKKPKKSLIDSVLDTVSDAAKLFVDVDTHNHEGSMNRDQAINYLVANCDCWKGKQTVLANKEAFADNEVVKLATTHQSSVLLANTMRQIATSVGAPSDLTVNAMPEFIKKKMAAAPAESTEPEEEEMDEYGNPVAKKKAPPMEPAMNKRSTQQWLAEAPPEAREMLANMLADNKRVKNELISKLVANAKAELQPRLRKTLEKNTVSELQDMLGAAPVVNKKSDPLTSYFGAAGGPNGNDDLVDNSSNEALEGVEFAGSWPTTA